MRARTLAWTACCEDAFLDIHPLMTSLTILKNISFANRTEADSSRGNFETSRNECVHEHTHAHTHMHTSTLTAKTEAAATQANATKSTVTEEIEL